MKMKRASRLQKHVAREMTVASVLDIWAETRKLRDRGLIAKTPNCSKEETMSPYIDALVEAATRMQCH